MKKMYLKPCCESIMVSGMSMICASNLKTGIGVESNPWEGSDEEIWGDED